MRPHFEWGTLPKGWYPMIRFLTIMAASAALLTASANLASAKGRHHHHHHHHGHHHHGHHHHGHGRMMMRCSVVTTMMNGKPVVHRVCH